MSTGDKLIRVLVVDDSLVCRELLSDIINRQPDMQTVAMVSSGKEAIEKNRKLRPDIITMDIQMPGMDGFATIGEIMSSAPVPILVVTSVPVMDGVDQTFRAISAGALDLVRKPELDQHEAQALVERIRVLAEVRVIRHRRPPRPVARRDVENGLVRRFALVAIAASTGGPKVLGEILSALPHEYPLPILLTQHLPDGFHHGFIKWLNQEVALDVRLARDGDAIEESCVYVAPSGSHLQVSGRRTISLSDAPPVGSHRPSADPMFESVADAFGDSAIGIVLSGMGRDGADGLRRLKLAGGLCIAQDEASSLIFGMPKAAIEGGGAQRVLGIQEIVNCLIASGSKAS